MNSLNATNLVPADLSEQEPAYDPDQKWELKALKPKHRQIAALVAQGMQNIKVAAIVGVTPEYVSMLMRQPLIVAEVGRLCEIAGTRMEALFEKSVDVVAEVLVTGSNKDKLAAARLQFEVTKRIGRPDPLKGGDAPGVDRLLALSERLVGLLGQVRGEGKNESSQTIEEGEFRVVSGGPEEGQGQAAEG